MKEILQEVKAELENAFDHPERHSLDESIAKLQSALEQNGDKGTMIQDAITALTQAKNAAAELEHAGTESASSGFGEAFNALDQAIESYVVPNNDPF
ncbi:hypothetical protein D1B31_05165 [Neobacillus notoginsengisoli]|uniref:Uncharacterized protein n=1 Tax=Neobacillus notoginsengisoli TaxID=1578198 RepID=A0A417YWT2_9BACI|nr:hypothetical protein [Neobacillus notoginsengisoli]RHW42034.1 hypothetical protein D1B31_05165 [Neobacillus notoginsengisoli]